MQVLNAEMHHHQHLFFTQSAKVGANIIRFSEHHVLAFRSMCVYVSTPSLNKIRICESAHIHRAFQCKKKRLCQLSVTPKPNISLFGREAQRE